MMFKENLSGFFTWDLPVVKISPEWVMAQSRLSPVVGLLPIASGPACLRMAFLPFLVKQLCRCDSVVISSFVRTGCTTRRWGWLLGRIRETGTVQQVAQLRERYMMMMMMMMTKNVMNLVRGSHFPYRNQGLQERVSRVLNTPLTC